MNGPAHCRPRGRNAKTALFWPGVGPEPSGYRRYERAEVRTGSPARGTIHAHEGRGLVPWCSGAVFGDHFIRPECESDITISRYILRNGVAEPVLPPDAGPFMFRLNRATGFSASRATAYHSSHPPRHVKLTSQSELPAGALGGFEVVYRT